MPKPPKETARERKAREQREARAARRHAPSTTGGAHRPRAPSVCSESSTGSTVVSRRSGDTEYLQLAADDFESDNEEHMATLMRMSGIQGIHTAVNHPRNTADAELGRPGPSGVTHKSSKRRRTQHATIEEEEITTGDQCRERTPQVDSNDIGQMLEGQGRMIDLLEQVVSHLAGIASVQKTSIERMDALCRATGLQQVRLEAIQKNITAKTVNTAPLYTNLEVEQPTDHTPVVHSSATGATGPSSTKPARRLCD